MDDAAHAERFDELCSGLLVPLVLGGPVEPVRPVGAELALRIGKGRGVLDLSRVGGGAGAPGGDLALRIDAARIRRARLLSPVDTLPDLDEASFALLAALNDLLQLTNHHLAGPLTRGRYARLEANLRWLFERIPAPRDVLEALSRHATFARALDLARTDSSVSWWTGSARFRGEPPPARLLAWPELRRVHVDARKVPLADMPTGAVGLAVDTYTDLLGLWLGRTPLTDLATAARRSPPFAWSASTLSLVAADAGRALALRALASEPHGAVHAALGRAAAQVPAGLEEAKRIAERFAEQAKERFEMLSGEGSGAAHTS